MPLAYKIVAAMMKPFPSLRDLGLYFRYEF
jgi:hypothetical protein